MTIPFYHVITIEVSDEQNEMAQFRLYQNDCLGLEEKDLGAGRVCLKAYFDGRAPLSEFIAQLSSDLPDVIKIDGVSISSQSPIFKPVPFDPIELIKNFWIIPPADMPTETKPGIGETLIIRPGMAFGTGRHESTQLAAGLIKKIGSAATLLDIGTGSGVLAIFAQKIGFKNVETVEIDADARDNAAENFELNGMAGLPIYHDIIEVKQSYDVVVANILAPTIIYLKDQLLRVMTPGGYLILSGIIEPEAPQIEAAFADLKLVEKVHDKEWVGFCYQFQ